jgi:hypothetical protein
MVARAPFRQSCRAIQKALAAVISLISPKTVRSRLTLMLPARGLPSASAAIPHIGLTSAAGTQFAV